MPFTIIGRRFAWRAPVALGAVVLVLVACEGQDRGTRTPLGQAGSAAGAPDTTLSAAAREQLAKGNEAFRAKKYADALSAYREAATLSPHHAAPYFGIQMAAKAMGNTALADSASRRIRALSPAVNPADSAADPHLAPPPAHPRS